MFPLLDTPAFCTQCGTPVARYPANFCGKCGHPFASASPSAPSPQTILDRTVDTAAAPVEHVVYGSAVSVQPHVSSEQSVGYVQLSFEPKSNECFYCCCVDNVFHCSGCMEGTPPWKPVTIVFDTGFKTTIGQGSTTSHATPCGMRKIAIQTTTGWVAGAFGLGGLAKALEKNSIAFNLAPGEIKAFKIHLVSTGGSQQGGRRFNLTPAISLV